jgi:ligand-binding SRPBCC domain-containing protein
MQSGAFKRFDHDHYFEWIDGKTVMTDHFDFNSPLGLLGQIVDSLLLKQYLTEFLVKRNATIKLVAESNPGDFLGC